METKIRLFRGEEDNQGVVIRLARVPNVGERIACVDANGSEGRFEVKEILLRDIDSSDGIGADVSSMLLSASLAEESSGWLDVAGAEKDKLSPCPKHGTFSNAANPCINCAGEDEGKA